MLNTGKTISLQKAWCFRDTKEQSVGLCPTLRYFTEKKTIEPLDGLAEFMNTFGNFGPCESEAVRFLSCYLSNSAREAYEAYTANEMNKDTHVYRGTWPVVIKTPSFNVF